MIDDVCENAIFLRHTKELEPYDVIGYPWQMPFGSNEFEEVHMDGLETIPGHSYVVACLIEAHRVGKVSYIYIDMNNFNARVLTLNEWKRIISEEAAFEITEEQEVSEGFVRIKAEPYLKGWKDAKTINISIPKDYKDSKGYKKVYRI